MPVRKQDIGSSINQIIATEAGKFNLAEGQRQQLVEQINRLPLQTAGVFLNLLEGARKRRAEASAQSKERKQRRLSQFVPMVTSAVGGGIAGSVLGEAAGLGPGAGALLGLGAGLTGQSVAGAFGTQGRNFQQQGRNQIGADFTKFLGANAQRPIGGTAFPPQGLNVPLQGDFAADPAFAPSPLMDNPVKSIANRAISSTPLTDEAAAPTSTLERRIEEGAPLEIQQFNLRGAIEDIKEAAGLAIDEGDDEKARRLIQLGEDMVRQQRGE